MARGLNKVLLRGNIGTEPEVRFDRNERPVVSFRLATNDGYYDSEGEFVETTEWHNVVAFGRLAEVLMDYAQKGQGIFFEGKNTTQTWEDSEGNTRYTHQVQIVRDMDLKPVLEPATQDDDFPYGENA